MAENTQLPWVGLSPGAAANVSGSFSTYFKRKEDIIGELNRWDFYRLAEMTNELPDADILERLVFYCRKLIEDTGIEICRQWIRNNLSPAEMDIRGEKTTKYAYDYRAMREVLGEAVKRSELAEKTPVDDLALYINAELYGLMVAWCMSDAEVVGSKKAQSFCNTVMKAASLAAAFINNELETFEPNHARWA